MHKRQRVRSFELIIITGETAPCLHAKHRKRKAWNSVCNSELKSSNVYTLLCFWWSPIFYLVAAFFFSSHFVSSCLLTSHISTLAHHFVFLSSFSLYHHYFIILLILTSSVIFPTSFSTYALIFLFFFSCGKYVQSTFSFSLLMWAKHVFVVLSRTASMICHYLKRIIYQLVLCKQLKTLFITGDTGWAVLSIKISFF